MTDQIFDTLIYQSRECPILAISGDGLSTPRDFGIQAETLHTGCYRGYYMRYLCREEQLFLDKMTVRAIDGSYPRIRDIEPFQCFEEMWAAMVYTRLCEPVSYTGGIVIGQNFRDGIGTIYPLKYYCYKTVIELLFENGRLQKTTNYSDQVAEQLEKSIHIADVFSLKYDFFYPTTLWLNNEG